MKKAIQGDQNTKETSQKKHSFFVYEYKLLEFIWIITHKSQGITLLSVSMIKGKFQIKQIWSNQKDESRLISKKTQMSFKLCPEKNNSFTNSVFKVYSNRPQKC